MHGIKFLQDWNIISVDELWTLWHVFVGDSDGHDEGDSWLDTAIHNLALVSKG